MTSRSSADDKAARWREAKELLAAAPPAAQSEPALSAIRDVVMRSAIIAEFAERRFWSAHHVDLVWRLDGEDVQEEADWLKDLWYLLGGGSAAPPAD